MHAEPAEPEPATIARVHTPAPETLAAGALLAGRYRVERLLGRGGMGAVYLAEHVELHRKVALKVLLPEIARSPEIVERFFREARAAATIGHPGIVDVLDLGRDGDTAFLAMEALDGEELAGRIAGQPPSFQEVVEIGALICDAIAAAHQRGIVHRDLKPANVFVLRGAPLRIKVLDFGIAKVNEPGVSGLTQTGQVMGTPVYMSPEAFRDAAHVDERTDVYAIGAMLFEMLTGQPPFVADSYPMLVLKVCGEERASVRSARPDVPDDLAAVVERALAKNLDRRTPTVRELGEALRKTSCSAISTDATIALPPDPSFASSRPPAPSPEPPGLRLPETPSPSVATPAVTPTSWPWPAVAVAAGVVVVVASLAAFGGGEESAAAISPPPAVTPSLEVPAPVPDAPAPAAAPEHRLELDVSPVGALVTSESGATCSAPCVLVMPEGPTVLTVTADAHRSQTIPLSVPLPSRLEIRLERSRSRPHGAPPPLRSP